MEVLGCETTLSVAKLLKVAATLRADDGDVGRQLGTGAERVSVQSRGLGSTGEDSKFVSELKGGNNGGEGK